MKGTAATLNPYQEHTRCDSTKRVAATLNPYQEHTRCDSTKGMAATPNPYIYAEDAAINLAILDEGHVS
jgi:hypothetical protein